MAAATASRMKSKLPACLFISLAFFEMTTSSRAEAQRIVLLAGRGGEDDRVRAQRMRKFDAHVAESAETDNADLLALGHAPVAHRRVGGDAGAEQRRGSGKVQIRGNAQHKGSSTTMLSE